MYIFLTSLDSQNKSVVLKVNYITSMSHGYVACRFAENTSHKSLNSLTLPGVMLHEDYKKNNMYITAKSSPFLRYLCDIGNSSKLRRYAGGCCFYVNNCLILRISF